MSKTARIETRMDPEVKEFIEFAAALDNTSVSNFAVKALIKASEEVINNTHTIFLTDEQYEMLERYLESGYRPNEKLKNLAKSKRKSVIGAI